MDKLENYFPGNEMGLINVLNLENGIDDWIKQNGPIEKINIKKN